MKNINLFIIALGFLVILVSSCEKDTDGLSHVSPKPIFELNGNSIELVQLNGSYTDAGVTVTQIVNGDTTELKGVQIYTALNTEAPGTYTISYAVESNGDIFHSDVSRTVVVYDDDVTGVYDAAVIRNETRVMDYPATVLIVKIAPNTYTISDWIGGWYHQYYGYGPRYAFAGAMGIDENNNVTHINSSDPWGYAGSLAADPAPVRDPDNDVITYIYMWTAGYNFDVTLTKR